MTKNTGVLDLVSKDTQAITSSKSSKSSDKTSLSLFDSMLQEVNKTHETSTAKETSDAKLEKKETQKINGNQSSENKTKDETSIEPKKDDTKQESIKTDIQKQETQPNTEEIATEVKSKNQMPSSLLDRLVHEAKTQIQKESAETQIKDTILLNDKSTAKQNVETQIKDTTLLNDKIITQQTVTKELTTQDTKNSLIQTQVTTTTTTTNISPENDLDLLAIDKKQQNQSSLIDRLLEEAKSLNTSLTDEVELDETTQKLPTQAVVSNIYLSSINKASADAMLGKVHEAKNVVSNANSIKEVQKGADLLNLGLQDSEVIVEDSEFNQNVKNEFLNKLSISNDVVKYDIAKMSQEIALQTKEATTVTTTNSLTPFSSTTDIDITVPSNLAFNIENRIIGAQQQMNSMMSDIARNMYLNYKPPITAFRMNLNPGHLGSISILMRSDKDSGLSISLNMSNAATLDSFVDNQATLRAALAKNFNTAENINLEFNMQDGQQQNKEQQNRKNDNKSNENHQATNDILENINQEIEISQKATNYM